jgi:SAM-dependent methyltransferase
MKGYKADHKKFCFDVKLSPSISHYRGKYSVITKVDLNSLYVRIVVGKDNFGAKFRLIHPKDTPHYQFVLGNEEPYCGYLKRHGEDVGYGREHSIEAFKSLLASEEVYLDDQYRSDYIVAEAVKGILGKKLVVLDGVHRVCQLISQGYSSVPIAILKEKPLGKLEQFDQYLKDYKYEFPEWYTPLEIKGRIIHERTYPGFKERPKFLTNRERGRSRWEFIVAKNLPELKGKTVCDLGSNIGLYSIFMAQLGAKKVDGYDRSEHVIQPTNPKLPRQNVVQQAYFVKNLFFLAGEGRFDNVNFFDCDIATMDFRQLEYDFFFSSCVLYHFGKKGFEEIICQLSKHTPEVFLQTNLGHKQGELAESASLSFQRGLLEKYGYTVRADEPPGYNYPVLYGKKKTCGPSGK